MKQKISSTNGINQEKSSTNGIKQEKSSTNGIKQEISSTNGINQEKSSANGIKHKISSINGINQEINSTNRLEMIFPSLAENERTGRTAAAVFAAVLDPSMEELCDFKTAVSEAVTNAIIHAYPDREGEVFLRMERKGNRIDVTVRDYGVGIKDVKRSMEPLYTTITTGERSGMGFTFMEAFTDDLKVVSRPGKGTTVLLTKIMGLDREGFEEEFLEEPETISDQDPEEGQSVSPESDKKEENSGSYL